VWPEPVERVAAHLRTLAVPATIQEFPDGTPTARDAAREVGCRLEQIVKSLVFVSHGRFILALVPGDRRADESRVAAVVGLADLRVATADEVMTATGFQPGAVAPFPCPAVTAVVMERALLRVPRVWIGAGSPFHMAEVAPSDLQRLTSATVAGLSVSRDGRID